MTQLDLSGLDTGIVAGGSLYTASRSFDSCGSSFRDTLRLSQVEDDEEKIQARLAEYVAEAQATGATQIVIRIRDKYYVRIFDIHRHRAGDDWGDGAG